MKRAFSLSLCIPKSIPRERKSPEENKTKGHNVASLLETTGNLNTEVVLIFFFFEVVLMQIWLVRPQWFCFDSAS